MAQPSHIYTSTLDRRGRRRRRRRTVWPAALWIAALGALLVLGGAVLLG